MFHSQCTIQDKVCNLIIDGESCSNVASIILIEKLGIPTIPHPKPYSLKWLNDGGSIKVTKQALISFSIGKKYRDNVLCDVVPVSTYHILLGQPRQFERHIMHDGFKNTYYLLIEKETIVQNLLPPNQDHKIKPTVGSEKKRDLLMLSEKQVERALSKGKQVLASIMLESNKSEEVTPLHPMIRPLISQYQDVFPQDLLIESATAKTKKRVPSVLEGPMQVPKSKQSNVGKEPHISNRDEHPKFTEFCSFDFFSYIVA